MIDQDLSPVLSPHGLPFAYSPSNYLGELLEGNCFLGPCGAVPFEEPSRSKFTQFMTDHILSYKNRDEFLPIMDSEGMSNHIGNNRRSS